MDNVVTKNYSDDEGNTLVIGGKLKVEAGAEVEGLTGLDSFPAASASTAGVVKVGAGLAITDGVLSVTPAASQADLEATEVADVVTAFNALLAKLKAAGLMA